MECSEDHINLMIAVENDDVDAASRILIRNHDEFLRPVGPLRITVVQLAAWKGVTQILDQLYERGADINAGDKIGRCALYYASHSGNYDVVKWLLQRGASTEARIGISSCAKNFPHSPVTSSSFIGRNLPLPECWGRTPLHEAVKNNHPAVTRILVEAGANVNAEDERGITPLLLAGSSVNPGGIFAISAFIEIIDILLSAKASANVIHPDTGTTALHHAAALRCAKAVQKLLERSAWPFYQCTSTGSTPLHIAASVGSVDTLRALLDVMHREHIDIRDKISRTALHRASYQGHPECVRVLINRGGSLAAETQTGVTVLDAIFAHIPRPLPFLIDILDSCVRMKSNSSDERSCISVDFNALTPNGELQMGVVSALIAAASDSDLLIILQHPLLEMFLRLKWSKLRMFFFLLVLVHVFFVLSLSSYAIILLRHTTDCTFPRRVLTLCSCILVFHNMAQILLEPRHYLKEYEIWLSFISATLSLVISVADDYQEMMIPPRGGVLNDPQHPSQWVLHSISLAILLGWMQMMLLVGRFPTWGYYALMFSTVLKNILKVLLAFVCLIVGFALSFTVLFHGNDQFRDSWRAVVKTVVMMMGEYEYGDLFPDGRNESSFLPATSRIVFLAFVMLASIVLMNLMIGLAVNDIQGLEKEGHIQRLLKQAEFVAHLERVTSHRIFSSNWLHPRLRILLNSRRSIPTKITFGCQKNYIHDSPPDIPAELMESLVLLASKKFCTGGRPLISGKYKNNEQDLTQTLRNLEQQLKQIRMSYNPCLQERKFAKHFIKRNQVRRIKSTVL